MGLRAYDIGGARVGGLICWEHWMPLARQVLHADGEQIHVAAWPAGREIYQLASRHYAFEGRAFVLLAASYLTKQMLPRGILNWRRISPARMRCCWTAARQLLRPTPHTLWNRFADAKN